MQRALVVYKLGLTVRLAELRLVFRKPGDADRAIASSLLEGDPCIDEARLTPLENFRLAAEGLLATFGSSAAL